MVIDINQQTPAHTELVLAMKCVAKKTQGGTVIVRLQDQEADALVASGAATWTSKTKWRNTLTPEQRAELLHDNGGNVKKAPKPKKGKTEVVASAGVDTATDVIKTIKDKTITNHDRGMK